MIPWNLLGKTSTPGGDEMALMHQPGEFLILAGGKTLMSSRLHGSEEAMAEMACRGRAHLDAPTVLIGGLGMGFTLRATLDLLPAAATVVVAELVAGVVEWNRGPLGHLANHPLRDRRVQVEVTPVDQSDQSHQVAVRRGAARRRQRALRRSRPRQRLALHRFGAGRHQARPEGRRHAGGVVGARGSAASSSGSSTPASRWKWSGCGRA